MENIPYMPNLEPAENGWVLRYEERQTEPPRDRPFDFPPTKSCTEVFTKAQTDAAFKRFRHLAESHAAFRYSEK